MARLENKQKPGLPRPPAPTRRRANPWKFSETGRKQATFPADSRPELLEGLVVELPAAEDAEPEHETWTPDEQAPTRPAAKRSGFGLGSLVVIGMAVLIALIALFGLLDLDLPNIRPWAWILKLLVIVLVVYGWSKARQGRKESKGIRTN